MAAKEGDQVKVHYTGKLKTDGSVFDSSQDREPLSFQIGAGQIIPGFENGIKGLEEGDKTTIEVTPEEGYGQHMPERMFEVDKAQVPEDLNPQVGQSLQVKSQDGQTAQVVVNEIKDDSIVLDANHPLAGKDLVFEVELVKVE